MQSQPPPKGSLEELFRHHLLESEAAAIPPRPLVWEHIDNGLLQAQNEKYRRRLLAYRWGMAASLLLATLAGGGWWHSQQVATATLASADAQREAARRAVAGAVAPATRPLAATPDAGTVATISAATRRPAGASAAQLAAEERLTSNQLDGQGAGHLALARTSQLGHQAAAGSAAPRLARHASASSGAGALTYAATSTLGQSTDGTGQVAGAAPTRSTAFSSPKTYAIAATATSSPAAISDALSAAKQPGMTTEALPSEAVFADNTGASTTALADSRSAEVMLATRLTTLALVPAAGLPTELAMQALPPPTPALLRRWRYGAEYTIGTFQPNIDFNRSTSDYNTALGFNTVSLTRAAAAEYRANLRPGLSQRLSLRATRWLGGHWSLNTGIEVTQQDAYSATSAAFTGEQLADLNSFSATPSLGSSNSTSVVARDLHDSSFRYRSAGVPIELQYDNQVKSGLSFYGRLGAIVSALLSVRSEVAGNAEATRTYSFMSASTPYRRLTALLRGSAGVRYRPAGRTWGLNVGPTAEAGVQSMNTETDRSFLQQRRPYSVGIEAGIEFGGLKPVQ